MRKLVGLTGLYCAGKNRVAALLEKRGLPVLDVDKLGHAAIEAERAAILSRFGGDLANPDGTVNRRLLGERAFGKPGEMAALQDIVHPAANRLTGEWLAAQAGKPCVFNAAVLHKSSVFGQLDFIILVEAPFFVRLLRARKRDGLSWRSLLKRFGSQKHFISQYLSGKADIYRVYNPSFGFRPYEAQLENRIDEILSGEGIF
ncbi:MAG: dephospho-CoA kinase [Treponema sp.]|jgi:dephospho-CoA kinase|nr:dephospho-CoA kinase [Treponema sp.]